MNVISKLGAPVYKILLKTIASANEANVTGLDNYFPFVLAHMQLLD